MEMITAAWSGAITYMGPSRRNHAAHMARGVASTSTSLDTEPAIPCPRGSAAGECARPDVLKIGVVPPK